MSWRSKKLVDLARRAQPSNRVTDHSISDTEDSDGENRAESPCPSIDEDLFQIFKKDLGSGALHHRGAQGSINSQKAISPAASLEVNVTPNRVLFEINNAEGERPVSLVKIVTQAAGDELNSSNVDGELSTSLVTVTVPQPTVTQAADNELNSSNQSLQTSPTSNSFEGVILCSEPEEALPLDSTDSVEFLSVSDLGPQGASTPGTRKPSSRSRDQSASPVRKRVRNEALWKRNINKTLKNSGLPYVTSKGIEHEGVKMRDPCSCKFDCRHRVSQEQRQHIHNMFWQLGSHSRQWEFIRANSTCKPTTSQEKKQDSQRKVSRQYHFVVDGAKIKVCKQMFMRTLSICDSWIDSSYKHVNPEKGYTVSPDKRGGHKVGRLVNMFPSKIDSVKKHVSLFPRVPSHYCRKRTKREYLEKGLSISKMAKLYSKWAVDENLPKTSIASSRQYRDIVNTRFNLGFFKPKKDQCSFCCTMKSKHNTRVIREERREAWVTHLNNKNLARALKDKDKSDGIKNKNVAVLSFDLQKQLSCPHSQDSSYYYHSKLTVYNFTIFNMIQREGTCYLWHAGIGKKGSDEVSSALHHYIEELVKQGYTDFRLWSDNCSGQNKNRNLFAMYECLAVKHGISITHRYLETGHTQMEVDSIHAMIERCTDKADIYDFDGWVEKIESAKDTLPKYKVVNFTQSMMISFKRLVNLQNWEFDLKREKVKWTKVREVNINGKEGNLVRLKYSYDCEGFVTLSPNKKGHPVNLKSFQPRPAHDGPLPLSERTIKDLTWLCDNLHVPITKQTFIRNVLAGVYPVPEEEQSDGEIESSEEFENDSEQEDGGLKND